VVFEEVETMSPTADKLVAQFADLPPHEQHALLHQLRDAMMASPPRNPKSLRGIWKGDFPNHFDVEAAIREIRTAWHQRLDRIAE
jgi:hypothetical protein